MPAENAADVIVGRLRIGRLLLVTRRGGEVIAESHALAGAHVDLPAIGRDGQRRGIPAGGNEPEHTRLFAVASHRSTATLLLSALATYSRRPSGESASASGVDPTGALGSSDVRIVSMTAAPAITLTSFDPESATNRRPSFDQTISLGWLPTAIRAVSRRDRGFKQADRPIAPIRDRQRLAVGRENRAVRPIAGLGRGLLREIRARQPVQRVGLDVQHVQRAVRAQRDVRKCSDPFPPGRQCSAAASAKLAICVVHPQNRLVDGILHRPGACPAAPESARSRSWRARRPRDKRFRWRSRRPCRPMLSPRRASPHLAGSHIDDVEAVIVIARR